MGRMAVSTAVNQNKTVSIDLDHSKIGVRGRTCDRLLRALGNEEDGVADFRYLQRLSKKSFLNINPLCRILSLSKHFSSEGLHIYFIIFLLTRKPYTIFPKSY